jgi:hypothetical protein
MTDTLLQRFASANPVTDDEAERRLSEQQWQAMFTAIVNQEDSHRSETARSPRWNKTRLTVFVAGATAIALIVPALWTNGPSVSPAAAGALYRAADVARSQRALPAPGPGQYLYTKTEDRQTWTYVPGNGRAHFLFSETLVIESWTSEDGSGRTVTRPQGVSFPRPQDRDAWIQAGRPELASPQQDRRDAVGDNYVLDLSQVPTDPDELRAAIERREILGGDNADWVSFQIIGELLHLSYRSPEHRAALYEVAANFPGVDYRGHQTDPLGRRGVSVSYEGGGHSQELIFDPKTAELLATRWVMLDAAEAGAELAPDAEQGIIATGPPGTEISWQLFQDSGVVNSTESRP